MAAGFTASSVGVKLTIKSNFVGNEGNSFITLSQTGTSLSPPTVSITDGFSESRTWTIPVKDGGFPSVHYYYSNYPGLLVDIGTPDVPGDGEWIDNGDNPTAPGSAYWLAIQYIIAEIPSEWQIIPVQAKDTGLPFVNYDLTSRASGDNQGIPALNTPTWNNDVIRAVEAFTQRDFSTVLELGYGSIVSINYKLPGRMSRDLCEVQNGATGLWIPDDPGSDSADSVGTCKQVGKFTKNQGWIRPGSIIDGDLVVDGTLAADKIQANTITATQIAAGTITASEITLAPQDVGVGTITGNDRIEFTTDRIDIFDSGVLRVRIGNLDPVIIP